MLVSFSHVTTQAPFPTFPHPHLLHLSCRRSIPWHHYRMPYVAWWSIAGELHRLRLVRWSHDTAKMPKVVVQRYPSHATGRRRLPQFLSPLNGFCRCSRRKKWGTHWVSLQIPTKTVVFLLFLQILYAVYIYIYTLCKQTWLHMTQQMVAIYRDNMWRFASI